MDPVHAQLVMFQDCTLISKDRYELTVNKTFRAGLTITSKLKPIFKSPDAQKYKDAEGTWSQAQNFNFPVQDLEFNIEHKLGNAGFGVSKTLKLGVQHKALSSYDAFAKEFAKAFSINIEHGQKLILKANDEVLNE